MGLLNSTSGDADSINNSPERNLLTRLRQFFETCFSEDELRTVCFDLGIDYDDLPSMGKAGKARELVVYYGRRGRIAELIAVARQLRSDTAWADVAEPVAVSSEVDLPFERQLTTGQDEKPLHLPQEPSFQLFEHLIFSVGIPLTAESIFAIVHCRFESVLRDQINGYLDMFVGLKWLVREPGERYRLATPDLSDRWHSRPEHTDLYLHHVAPSIECWRDKHKSIDDYPEDLLLILAHQRHCRHIEPFSQPRQAWPSYGKWQELAIRYYQYNRSELFARLVEYRCGATPAPHAIECALLSYLADRIKNHDQQYKANHRYLWAFYISDEPDVQDEYQNLRKWLLDRSHDEPIPGLLQAALRASDAPENIEPLIERLLTAPSQARLFALRYLMGPVFRNRDSELWMVIDRLRAAVLSDDDLLALSCGLAVTFRERRPHWALELAMGWLDDLHGRAAAVKPLFMALLPALPADKRAQYTASLLASETDKQTRAAPTDAARPTGAGFTSLEIDALVEEIVVAHSAGALAPQQVRWPGNRREYGALVTFVCDALAARGVRGKLLQAWDLLNAAVTVYPDKNKLRLAGLAAYLRCCKLLDLDHTLPGDTRSEVLAVGDVFQNTKDRRVIVTLVDLFLEGQISAQRMEVLMHTLITTNPDLVANEWLLDALAEQPSIRIGCYQAHKKALDSDRTDSDPGESIAENLEKLLEEPLAELQQKYEEELRSKYEDEKSRQKEIAKLCRDWTEEAQRQINQSLRRPIL